MPSRKTRPGKHGLVQTVKLKDLLITAEESILAKKLIVQEDKEPGKDHYVGWPDMHDQLTI